MVALAMSRRLSRKSAFGGDVTADLNTQKCAVDGRCREIEANLPFVGFLSVIQTG